jgi:hypothetical protein
MAPRKVNPLPRLRNLTEDEVNAGRLLDRIVGALHTSTPSPMSPEWLQLPVSTRGAARGGLPPRLAFFWRAYCDWLDGGHQADLLVALEVAVLWVGTRKIDARSGLKHGTTRQVVKRELERFAGLIRNAHEKKS